MHLSFQIRAIDSASFISHWSLKYQYPREHKYTNNIGNPLTVESLRELFEWKNGTGDEISSAKAQSIADNYPLTFDGDKRTRYLSHEQPGGAIWNIFYLHCLEPRVWPIFDQHTFRAMRYLKTGRIEEIGDSKKQKYAAYMNEYIPFLENMQASDQRTVDKALFAFGRFLKLAAAYV